MSRYNNNRKKQFLEKLPDASLESKNDTLTIRCKFNFAYMDFDQEAGQRFEDWNQNQLARLFVKLHHYSKESLKYWMMQPYEKQHVLEIYDCFPAKSAFNHPKHVPHEVEWGRFRLEGDMRLIGFVVPTAFDKKTHEKTCTTFCRNTFYVVFLDAEHEFYQQV